MTQRVREGAEQACGGGGNRSSFPNCDRAKQGLKVRKEEVVVAGGVKGQGPKQEGAQRGLGAPWGKPGSQAKSSKLLLQAQTAFSSCLALAQGPRNGPSQCEQAEPPDTHQAHCCPMPTQGLTLPAPGILSDSQ